MRPMRPAVSSTAAWLPGAASLHSSCMTLPLLQPTSACTSAISNGLLLSGIGLREPALYCPRQFCPSVKLTLETHPNSQSLCLHDSEH